MTNTINIPAKNLVGLYEEGPSSFAEPEGSGAQFAEQLWRKFIAVASARGAELGFDLSSVEMYGVSWPADDAVPPQRVHYFCGFEHSSLPEGLSQLRLEGGRYFQFTCEVPANQLDKGFEEAYFTAFPASGLVERDGQHLEIYGPEYDPTSPVAKFRILIPIAD